jgi:hypothetical protein
MVMLGGAGTLSGPVYGALILLAIPLIIDRLGGAPGSVTLLIYSLIVIAVVTFAPHGVSGVASRLLRRARERGAPDVAEQLQVPSIAGAPSAFTPARDRRRLAPGARRHRARTHRTQRRR